MANTGIQPNTPQPCLQTHTGNIVNTYRHVRLCLTVIAFRLIDFRGTHTNKAQYIRLSSETSPDLVLDLLIKEWGLEKPRLLITTTGGKINFDLQPWIKRSLRRGLLKAAKITGAWILTGGTNNGVNRHVGDALMSEKTPRIKGYFNFHPRA